MRNLVRFMQVLIFSLALSIPIILLLWRGPAMPFERRAQTAFPSAASLLSSNPQSREQLADAIFERSLAKKMSVASKTAILRDAFGFVDEGDVVSGAPEWLFFKPSLSAWDCTKHSKLLSQLERFETLAEIADAADANILYVVAPNKASVENSVLLGRSSIRAKCYLEFESNFRSALNSLASKRVVDHHEVLRVGAGKLPTYYRTDTHWNSFGGALITKQLFERLVGTPYATASVADLSSSKGFVGDLNEMLLSSRKELDPQFKVLVSDELKAGLTELSEQTKILLIHDSFYARLRRVIQDSIPNVSFERVGPETFKNLKLDPSDFIIIETVERNFLGQAASPDFFGWGSPVGDWLLERSSQQAEDCHWQDGINLMDANPEMSTSHGLNKDDMGNWVTTNGDQQIKIAVPSRWTGKRVCFDIAVTSDQPSPVQLFLPIEDQASGDVSYSGGASIVIYPKSGEARLRLVLPSRIAGRTIRLRPSRRARAKINDLRIAAKPQGS